MCVHVIDDLFRDVADGAHRDDHAVSVRRTVVVEETVVGAEFLVDLAHVLLDDPGDRVVVRVAGFSVLEEDIPVLGRAAEHRVLGVDGAGTERGDRVHIHHLGEIFVIPDRNLLDLVRGAEAVKEVDERHATLDRREVCDGAEVHNFLLVGLGEHRETGLTAGINVGVIPEDVQRVRSDATGRDMNDAGEQLAGDLIHIRDHQEQTLRRRVGGRQRTGSERAVYGTGGACLGLHLDDFHAFPENVSRRLTENVLIGRRPGVGHLCHRAGRGDRVNRGDFRERVRYVRGCRVTVHRKFFSFYHWVILRLCEF